MLSATSHAQFTQTSRPAPRVIIFDSLSRQKLAVFAADNAFRVVLDADDKLHWIIEIDDEQLDYSADPDTRWYQRWLAALVRMLPIDRQL